MALTLAEKFSRMSGAPCHVAKWILRFYLIMFGPLLILVGSMAFDHPGIPTSLRLFIDYGPWLLIVLYSMATIIGVFHVPRFAHVALLGEKIAKVPCEHCLYLLDEKQNTCPECGREINFATLVAKWKPWCDRYRKRVNLAKGP